MKGLHDYINQPKSYPAAEKLFIKSEYSWQQVLEDIQKLGYQFKEYDRDGEYISFVVSKNGVRDEFVAYSDISFLENVKQIVSQSHV